MNIKKQLGERIKNIRKSKGLTQEQLAELVDISPRNLSRIEVGDCFMTSVTLEKIIEALNITPESLFRINYLKPQEDLVEEIITSLKSIKNREHIEIIYKFIKPFD